MPNYFEWLDLWLFHVLTPWHSPLADHLMSWISVSGTASALWLVLGAVAMTNPQTRAAAWRLLLVVLLCYVVVDLVAKPLIARGRPISLRAYDAPRDLPPMPRSLSFPSGHSAAAFGCAMAVARIWPQARVLWWTVAVVMAYSRIYVGHHYPLDVAGGAVAGVLIAFWVLGGRQPATYASPLRLPPGAVVRP